MRRNAKLCFTLLCIILCISVLSGSALAAVPKRILLIVMDGARYDYCTPETMPNLFSFMEKALIFSNAYAPSSWTLPSHASLFTGLYPQQHGAFKMPYHPETETNRDTKKRLEEPINLDTVALPQESLTIADILHSAGYQTLGVFGNPCYGYSIFNLQKGFDTWLNPVEEKLKVTGMKRRGFYSFDYEVDGKFYTVIPNASEVAQNVSKLLKQADFNKSIFLFINFEDPIATRLYFPPDKRNEIYANYEQYLKNSMNNIDDTLMPILSLFQDGLIIVTSDHGQGDGKTFKCAEHATSLFPEQTKIPLFVHNNLEHFRVDPAAPIDLTLIMDMVLKAAGLESRGKKKLFSADMHLAFSHLDPSPTAPIGTKSLFGIFSEQALLLVDLRSGGLTKYCFKQKTMQKSVFELMVFDDELSEKILPFMKLEKIFPATGKIQKLDEGNIETLKGLGYIE